MKNEKAIIDEIKAVVDHADFFRITGAFGPLLPGTIRIILKNKEGQQFVILAKIPD